MEYSFRHKLEKNTDDCFFSKINNGFIQLQSNGYFFIKNSDFLLHGNYTFENENIIFNIETMKYKYEILDNRVDFLTLKRGKNVLVFYRPLII